MGLVADFLVSPWTFPLFIAVWVNLCILFVCLSITQDWRLRAYFARGTAGLSEEQLEVAYVRNLAVVASYLEGRPRVRASSRSADRSLIMCTVLQEHLARVRGEPLPRSYLRARKMCLRAAQQFEPSEDHPTHTPQA